MKKFNIILSILTVFVLMISFSGEILHVHYCYSSKTYSLDVHPASQISLDHQLCNCNSSESAGCNNSDSKKCCSHSGKEIEGSSCCVDIHAGLNSDNNYNFQIFKPQFKALSTVIFYSSEPVYSDFYKTNAFEFKKTQDHSPPELIKSQILLI